MPKTLFSVIFAVLGSFGSFAGPAAAAHDNHQILGKVHFETSCRPPAQKLFDRAMLYQHSFWYSAAKRAFEEVAKADPDCAMAYWGVAMSLLYNPFGAPPAKNLPDGFAAIQKAKAAAAKTPRERDLIEALAAYYTDYETRGHGARVRAYATAMEQVAQRYSDDEVQIFYALALNVSASLADKTYANQLKAAAILEKIFKRQPQHPGVAHYLIHTYDYPPIAERGLEAAKRYSKIAPAAPHAQHMPSHIFTRVGYWRESIVSNINSAKAAKASNEVGDQLHAMDYMIYAYLQLAEDKKARQVIDELATIEPDPDRPSGAYARAAGPARYAIERADWKAAAELEVRPSKIAYVDAISHFARALGAARSGQPEKARVDIARLAELRDQLRQANDSYSAGLVDVQHQAAGAWLLLEEGKADEGLAALSAAADAEDKTEKAPITPGPLAPARELYGYMLLERDMPKEALAAFEATLKKEPNRFRALYGAAKAAEMTGEKAKARTHFGVIAKLTRRSDAGRPEVVEARTFGSGKRKQAKI